MMAALPDGAMHADIDKAGRPTKKAPASPCDPGMSCQATTAVVILPDLVIFGRVSSEPASLPQLEQTAVLSRPPDPGRRPPIQL